MYKYNNSDPRGVSSSWRRRPWGDQLPNLVLHNIVMRLDCISSYVKFACVCCSWRAAAKEAAADFVPSQPPMLVYFTRRQDVVSFYELPETKVYHKCIQGIGRLRCIGNSRGWLIMARCCSPHLLVVLNPFTGVNFEIPPNDAITHDDDDVVEVGALSSSPSPSPSTTTPDCVLFVVSRYHVCYYRFGPGSGSSGSGWTARVPRPSCMDDLKNVFIIENRVYAVTRMFLVTVIDIVPPTLASKYLFEIHAYPLRRLPYSSSSFAFYSCHDHAAHLGSTEVSSAARDRRALTDAVSYRFDSSTKKWMEDELAGRSLFLCMGGTGGEVYDRDHKNLRRHEIYATSCDVRPRYFATSCHVCRRYKMQHKCLWEDDPDERIRGNWWEEHVPELYVTNRPFKASSVHPSASDIVRNKVCNVLLSQVRANAVYTSLVEAWMSPENYI